MALLPALLVLTAFAPGISRTGAAQDAFRTIRGLVVAGDDSGLPLRRVKILLAGSGVVATPAYTDSEGRFEIPVPRTAAYTLKLTKAGFAPLDVEAAALRGEAPVLTMARGAAVVGRVLDQYGDPLFARVLVRPMPGAPAPAAVDWFGESDDLGEFRVGSLPAGRYEVTLQALNQPVRGSTALRDPVIVQLHAGQEEVVRLVYEGQPPDPRGQVIGASGTPVVENGGAIRGSVIGPDGRGVAGAFLALTIAGRGARESASDADGRYEFVGLPPGAYRLTASKFGTSLMMRERNVEIQIAERQVHDGMHLAMERRPAIVGSVLDEYGDPMEGLIVQAGRLRRGGGRSLLEMAMGPNSLPKRTDDRGRFRVTNLLPGDYYVVAGEAPRIVGDVATGPDTSLRVYYPGTPSIANALTVRVAAGQDTLGVNIGYAPAAGARVYGYAFDSSGQPLNFPVTLMESFRSGHPVIARREALVRGDGAFTFLNVPPGDYVVQGVRRPTPDLVGEFAVEHVSVGSAEVPPVTLRTSQGTTVRGRVVLDGDRSSVSLDSFGVAVYPTDLDYNPIGQDLSGSGVREDGTFELRAQGPARITSAATPQGWWMKSATIGGVDVADQPYTFAGPGDVPGDLVVVFSDAVAEISGGVIDARGQMARDWTVLAFPVDETRRYLSSRYIRLARPASAAAGDTRGVATSAFRVFPLPPGEYWILAVDRFDVATEWHDAGVMESLAPLAQRITVTERERVTRDLRLVERPRP